jgi:hypothetical protein
MSGVSAMRLAVAVALALAVVGCSSNSPGPQQPPSGDPTPLATEAHGDATDRPAATKPPATTVPAHGTPTPTKKPNFYTPPGWDGFSDVDCKELGTHAHAVSFFRGTGGSKTKDPYGLDGEHDGNPCETLP